MTTKRFFLPLALLAFTAVQAQAQSEEALRNAFMGRRVTIRVDMPASHKGIDLRFDKPVPFDLKENSDRIREHDASLVAGDSIPVTFIKVKGDLIEVHLGGGGFNWFSDSTTRTASATGKSNREKDLENDIKRETDRERRRRLERELDDLRRDRERQDARERRDVEDYNRGARERDLERALRSGSRFNLRFKKNVPFDALTPAGFERYLDAWVDFSARADRRSSGPPPSTSSGSARDTQSRDWKKGTPRREMEDALGRARRERSCPGDDGGLECKILTFDDGPDEIDATFVEGILVRYATKRR
ncbi:MAG: hypothetical protein ABIR28_13085 [Vicinamibacteria bacterium]